MFALRPWQIQNAGKYTTKTNCTKNWVVTYFIANHAKLVQEIGLDIVLIYKLNANKDVFNLNG